MTKGKIKCHISRCCEGERGPMVSRASLSQGQVPQQGHHSPKFSPQLSMGFLPNIKAYVKSPIYRKMQDQGTDLMT